MAVLKKNIFAIIEVGSSKIICVIFSIHHKEIKILGFASGCALGIKNGVITNMKEAMSCIACTVEKAEGCYGKIIEEVYVVICGSDIQSEIIHQDLMINGKDVTEKDLKHLTNKANEMLSEANDRTILHSINNGYALDDLYVSYPIGMYANKLAVSTNFISCMRIPLININQVFAGCRLNIKDHLVASYMESFSCLNEDDKNIGASVINFGAHSTSVVTFKNGCLISCFNINLGSAYLTFDVAHAFGISLVEAEKLKISQGTLITLSSENYYENIQVEQELSQDYQYQSNNQEPVLINKYDFLSVLLARQEEIIEMLINKGKSLNQVISDRKIILTGGGSKISGLNELIKEFIPARSIRNYDYIENLYINNQFSDFNLNDSAYSAIIGSIKYIYNMCYKDFEFDLQFKKDHLKGNIFSKVLEFFKN